MCEDRKMSENEAKIFHPDYDIVTSKCDILKEELLKSFHEGITQTTIDLDKVSVVDSTGLSVLISAHNSLKKNGHTLELINVSENIQKLLSITRLDKHFRISKS
jgi:stage II sporulation protein AA (anti-sigma F factor antagonist)